MTQNNLGDALRGLAIRVQRPHRRELLIASLESLHRALEIFTEEAAPGLHRMTLGNLAETSWELAVETESWEKAE
jgi:hypothetical protein